MSYSMQSLFGLIRALKMIIMSGLVDANIPVHLFLFMIGAIQFAKVDIFDGSGYYE